MRILRDPTSTSSIADPDIRGLVEQRFAEICAGETYDYDLHGHMIVVEPGDSADALEKESKVMDVPPVSFVILSSQIGHFPS